MGDCECGAKVFCPICGKTHICLRWCNSFRDNMQCDVSLVEDTQ